MRLGTQPAEQRLNRRVLGIGHPSHALSAGVVVPGGYFKGWRVTEPTILGAMRRPRDRHRQHPGQQHDVRKVRHSAKQWLLGLPKSSGKRLSSFGDAASRFARSNTAGTAQGGRNAGGAADSARRRRAAPGGLDGWQSVAEATAPGGTGAGSVPFIVRSYSHYEPAAHFRSVRRDLSLASTTKAGAKLIGHRPWPPAGSWVATPVR